MTECQRAGGEFRGWSRAEIDVFIEGLTDLFVRTALWGYGGAVPRKDWNELIKGDALALHGDAEGRCIRNVYVRSLDWAEKRAGGSSISYVFDERPQRIAENSLLYEIFRSLHEDKSDFGCPACRSSALAYPTVLEDDQPVACAGCGALICTYGELKQRAERASILNPPRFRVSGC